MPTTCLKDFPFGYVLCAGQSTPCKSFCTSNFNTCRPCKAECGGMPIGRRSLAVNATRSQCTNVAHINMKMLPSHFDALAARGQLAMEASHHHSTLMPHLQLLPSEAQCAQAKSSRGALTGNTSPVNLYFTNCCVFDAATCFALYPALQHHSIHLICIPSHCCLLHKHPHVCIAPARNGSPHQWPLAGSTKTLFHNASKQYQHVMHQICKLLAFSSHLRSIQLPSPQPMLTPAECQPHQYKQKCPDG